MLLSRLLLEHHTLLKELLLLVLLEKLGIVGKGLRELRLLEQMGLRWTQMRKGMRVCHRATRTSSSSSRGHS